MFGLRWPKGKGGCHARMNRSSQGPTYLDPGCYNEVINRRSSIVWAEAGFGKARLMEVAQDHLRVQGLSVKLALRSAANEEDLFRQIRLALGEQVWCEIEAKPARIHQFIHNVFGASYLKSAMHEWKVHENEDVDQSLRFLAMQHAAHAAVIRKLIDTPADGVPARAVNSLIQTFQACVRALTGSDVAHAYLWLRADDSFNWQPHLSTVRALVNGMGRGRGNVHVKLFITPAELHRLSGDPRSPAIDGEVQRIALTWPRRLLEAVADAVCQAQAGAPLAQLVQPQHMAALSSQANVLPLAPGAWIALAEQVCALRQQYRCAVLSEELWREALTQYCQSHRRLRIVGNKVYAFGEEIKIDRVGVEILQVIHAWQNDPHKPYAHPQAQQIADEINKRRPKTSRRLADGESIHANISRLRGLARVEPVYHLYKKAPATTKRAHLIHIKGDKDGYFLENVDWQASAGVL